MRCRLCLHPTAHESWCPSYRPTLLGSLVRGIADACTDHPLAARVAGYVLTLAGLILLFLIARAVLR